MPLETDAQMLIRLCKTLFVAACALHWTLVALNNIVDYDTNLQFVKHVLSMDTVFPADQSSARAIHNGALHHANYLLIIATEVASALLCWTGAFRCWRARHASKADWEQASSTAVLGLTLVMFLFFTGFVSVGGEWFMMWQSRQWNGVEPATRLFLMHGLILLWLTQAESPDA